MPVKPSTTTKQPVKKIVEPESEDEDETEEDEDESEEETESEEDDEDSEEDDSEEEEEEKKAPSKSVAETSAGKPASTTPKEQIGNRSTQSPEEYVKKTEFDHVKHELKVLMEQKIPKLEQEIENLQILIDKSVVDNPKYQDAVDAKLKADEVKDKKLIQQVSVQESDQNAIIDEIYAKQKEHSLMLETLLRFMEQYKEEQSTKQKASVLGESSSHPVDSSTDQTKEVAQPSANSHPIRPAGPELVKSDSMVDDLDEESRLLLCSKLIEMRKLSFAELIYQLNQ